VLNRRVIGFLALFLGCGAMAAEASDFTPYVGIGGGMFGVQYKEQKALGGLKLNKRSWGSFIRAGVDYQQYMGVEVRTGVTGRVSDNFPAGTLGSITPIDLTLQITNFISYMAKFQYPATQRFKAYALLGGTAGHFKIGSRRGLSGWEKTWKTGFSYGVGAEYRFRSQGSIAVEWMQYLHDVPLSIVSTGTSKGAMYGASIMINRFF